LLLNGDLGRTDLADAVAGKDYEVFIQEHIMQDELKHGLMQNLLKQVSK
jgi:hypothetical protein